MNCQQFQELTAWPCRRAKGTLGEDITVLAPPVSFWDGTVIPVYIFDRGEQVEITDDGGVLDHLDMSGFAISGDKRRRKGLEKTVAKWNVGLDTELQLWCKPNEIAFGLQRYLGALFAVAHWEAENAGKPIDNNLLIAEAEIYLCALNPSAEVKHDVGLQGISGRSQMFPLQLGSTYYDAVGQHPASSSSMVKKLFDIRSIRSNKDTPITLIVDDSNEERAKADIQIFTQLAHVNRFSQLRHEARAVMTSH